MKQLCNNDTFPQKVDLVIGAYRGEDAKPWILPVVRKACHEIDNQSAPIFPISDTRVDHGSLLIGTHSVAE